MSVASSNSNVSSTKAIKVQRAHAFISFVSMSDDSHGPPCQSGFRLLSTLENLHHVSPPSPPPRLSLSAGGVTHERAHAARSGGLLYLSSERLITMFGLVRRSESAVDAPVGPSCKSAPPASEREEWGAEDGRKKGRSRTEGCSKQSR